ncbi:unnamed protein product [Penicillium bialowiezense]
MPAWIAATLNINNSNGPTIPVIDSPIKRWVMLAQYATDVLFIVAHLHEEYVEYLTVVIWTTTPTT